MPEILVTDANILIDLAIVLEHELLLLRQIWHESPLPKLF